MYADGLRVGFLCYDQVIFNAKKMKKWQVFTTSYIIRAGFTGLGALG